MYIGGETRYICRGGKEVECCGLGGIVPLGFFNVRKGNVD